MGRSTFGYARGNGYARTVIPRRYWAQRQGPLSKGIDLPVACRLFRSTVEGFAERGYFQEWFGYECVDQGLVTGLAGADTGAFALRRTRLEDIWPLPSDVTTWDQSHLMTAIEFLHDVISKPIKGDYHSWSNCGWHYTEFDPEAGRQEFREEINPLLADLEEGFELGPTGEIVRLAPPGLAPLLDAPVPPSTDVRVGELLADAIQKFRNRASSVRDRRDAVRDLSGALELLRPKLKGVLDEPDEDALFNIANNFAIRHENERQRRQYDPAIWLSWMFYFYLATIHAAIRLIERSESKRHPR